MTRRQSAFLLIIFLVATRALSGAQLLPNSNEFQVNVYATSAQNDPGISAAPTGDFVVTWTSYGPDGDQWGVFARRFASSTAALSSDFQINTYTTGYQQNSELTVGPNGDFVVVWESYQDGSYDEVFAQRFGSSGNALGTEFQVNTQTVGYQGPAVIGTYSGGFVITWNDYVPDTSENVRAQRYDSNGVPQGTEFQVNTFTTGSGSPGSVIASGGGFLIVWDSFGQDGDSGGVFVRRFDSAGTALGTEFQVNTYTTGFQGSPRGAASADGSFVIVWIGEGDGSSNGVFGQRFDSSGVAVGSQFQVNTFTTGPQTRSTVSVGASGEFVVTWQSLNEDGSGYGIFARSFASNGIPTSSEFQVNQFTTGHQTSPAVASLDERSMVIVWQSQQQDGELGGIFGRRFRFTGDPIDGKKLYIRTPSSGPSHNAVIFVSTDSTLDGPLNAVEDPRCSPVGSGSITSGARLRVNGAGGDFTIDLPCVNWSANGSGTRYRYRDASGATCKAIVLRPGKLLKASCQGPQVAYALGAAQGNVHVTLSTGDPGTNRKYCATFGPLSSATVVRDGTDGRSYRAIHAGAGVCQ